MDKYDGVAPVLTNSNLRDRFRGCLLGGAVGDALGAPVEFLRRSEILRRFGPSGIRDYAPAYGRLGAITDDTQMSLFTAEGMLRAWSEAKQNGGEPAFVQATATAYLRWLLTQGRPNRSITVSRSGKLLENRELFSQRAPGNTCVSALRQLQALEERATNHSKGCGGIMRVAPIGMFMSHWISDDPKQIGKTFQIAADIAAITHGHPTGYLAAGAFAVVVALTLRGISLAEAVCAAKSELRNHEHHEETLAAIESAERLSVTEPNSPDAVRKLGEGWVSEEALAISLYCALCARDFDSGVVLAVNHDGDSDSTGSITGNLLGSICGVNGIPKQRLEPLELRDVIEKMADDLAAAR